MYFKFYVDETYSRSFVVEAKNEKLAFDKINDAYRNDKLDIVMDGFPSFTNIECDGEADYYDMDFCERI